MAALITSPRSLISASVAVQAGRLLLRAAAVRSEGVNNTAVVYGRTEKGKPILVGQLQTLWLQQPLSLSLSLSLYPAWHQLQPQSPVQVNISHQGQYAVLALERGREGGVDDLTVHATLHAV